jgi:cytochrome P450
MTQPLATDTGRVEIDFSVYNPFDMEFMRDPFPTYDRLLSQYPVAFHTGINAWLVSPNDLVTEALRDPRFSARTADWSDAPPPKPESQWNLFDRMSERSLLNVDRSEHLRLRRLTNPAFSRRVMDKIEASVRDTIAAIFDEIEDPREFNVATEIALKVPVRSIARMVGVAPEAESLFEHGLGWNMVRAGNPMYSAQERDQFAADCVPGLQYILDMVAARRGCADPGDDFIGTLLAAEESGERLTDVEILSVISALVVAGADTAVDLHTYALYALLTHPGQRELLRSRPDLMEAATLEILRWAGHGKFGGIPRYPVADTELGGQVLEKGSFVMPLFSPAWNDPRRWPEPRRFDITRDHSGNIIFGAGPHLCIGLNLVKVQAKLMIEEFDRRFGDTAELAGEIEWDPMHFNARRMTTMMVTTGA